MRSVPGMFTNFREGSKLFDFLFHASPVLANAIQVCPSVHCVADRHFVFIFTASQALFARFVCEKRGLIYGFFVQDCLADITITVAVGDTTICGQTTADDIREMIDENCMAVVRCNINASA